MRSFFSGKGVKGSEGGTPLECIHTHPAIYPQVIRPAVIIIDDRAAVKS